MPSRTQLANAIRALSMDAVQKANSGHPGMPMGMADIAEVLWNDFLRHNPHDPHWANRDRFILSNGHGCMLQYALLHLTGYDVSIDDLKNFRQLHSKTPGHPEYGVTPGVETTTGPLGQGLANGVGMALAERSLATQFNRDGFPIVDHYTYVFCGDGCLMEGISHEACSFAGTQGLGKLIVFYDSNGISIDGNVEAWFTDDTAKRFHAYHWHVVADVDGHDPSAIKAAIEQARSVSDKPSLIICKTQIAFGAPTLANTAKAHGAPLGASEIEGARKKLGWNFPAFTVPNDIYATWDAREKGAAKQRDWQQLFAAYQQQHPTLAAELSRRLNKQLPLQWQDSIAEQMQKANQNAENMATRKASKQVIDVIGTLLPELIGGSADLSESNLTWGSNSQAIDAKHPQGNYLYYGVREFGMAAIMNGIALHGGFIPYGGTFLTFQDYARNAVRLSALSKQRVIYVFTHDSIGLGEDGPTHQPIEQLPSLRLLPNMSVWRPCDTVETIIAWQAAVERQDGPTSLILSRQTVSHQPREPKKIAAIKRGGYILIDCNGTPDAIIIATGSEVSLAVAASEQLTQQGRKIRVVSMPSTDTFDAQDDAYRGSVLPASVSKRVAVEAASADYWYKYVGLAGKIIGLNRFGESAPAADVYQALGITTAAIVAAVNSLL